MSTHSIPHPRQEPGDGRHAAPPIEYRTPPVYLTTGQLAREIVWLGSPRTWSPAYATWARGRRDDLRAELIRREGSDR